MGIGYVQNNGTLVSISMNVDDSLDCDLDVCEHKLIPTGVVGMPTSVIQWYND